MTRSTGTMGHLDTSFDWVQPSDVEDLQGLFTDAFGRQMSKAYYRWQFLECPLGERHAAVARADGTIVSHVGYSPRALFVNGEAATGLIKCSSMTHPDYQGRGIYTSLMSWCHERFSALGFSLVLSWPNARNHASQRNRTPYVDICLVPTMKRHPKRERSANDQGVPFPMAPDADMAEWEELARGSRGAARYGILRSAAYLRWRYQQHPDTDYYVIENRKAGILEAALVFKLYPAGAPDRINIVDWLCSPTDRSGEVVLAALEDYAESVGLPTTIWHSVHDYPRYHVLERRGYVLSEPIFYFGAFALQPPRRLGPYADWRNWCLSMGDVDVF